MAFSRPTLSDLLARARTDIEGELPGSQPRLRYTPEKAIGQSQAGLAHSLHGHIAWAAKQWNPNEADSYYMRISAAFFGIFAIPAAKATSSQVAITGTGTTLAPEGTLWQRSDGTQYIQDNDVNLVAGAADISVTAVTAGLAGNSDAGTVLTIVSPISGIVNTATMTTAATGGVDDESDAAILSRLNHRLQFPPMGGGPGNYVSWAREVPGVTRAWEYPLMNGAGSVGVAFVRDGDGDGVDIIPSPAEVADVQEYIDSVAPLTTDGIVVFAPTAVLLATEITPFISPGANLVAVKAAITAELADYLQREGKPGVTLPLSQINEAISQAEGLASHVLVSPVADVTHAADEIPVLDTPTWVP